MTALILSAVSSTAGAAEIDAPAPPPAERWDDGLTGRAPDTASAGFAGTWVPGRDDLLFADLRAGAPLARSADGRVAVGLSGGLATSSVRMGDGRHHDGIRSLGLDVWLMFLRDDSLTAHSVVAGYHRPVYAGTETSWFLATPNEIAPRLTVAYDGYFDFEGFDLAVQGRHTIAQPIPFEATWTTVFLVEAGRDLVVGMGATIGLLPYGTAVAVARYRPADRVELGLGASIPFPQFDPARTRVTVQPTAEIKIFR